MKNILSKIYIHPFFYLFMFITVLTGHFKDFIFISIIILIHEIGHSIMGLYYKWRIDKIKLFPAGGITIFKVDINKPLIEEFLILIAGPIFQLVIIYILNLFIKDSSLLLYSNTLVLFNLLPVIPLDGSKLLNIILNYNTSFSYSYKLTSIISLISLIIMFLIIAYINNLILLTLIIFLIIENIKFIKNKKLVFNKFILERLNNEYNFKKRKLIYSDNLNKMMRDKKHNFYLENSWKTEREIIRKKFDFYRTLW